MIVCLMKNAGDQGHTRWKQKFSFIQVREIKVGKARAYRSTKCRSFLHLWDYYHVLTWYEHVFWMLLDIVRKGSQTEKNSL